MSTTTKAPADDLAEKEKSERDAPVEAEETEETSLPRSFSKAQEAAAQKEAPAGRPPTGESAEDVGFEDDDSGGGAPAWIVTFADMMSLLLCFFVLLLSFSVIDAEKFREAAESLKAAFQFTVAPIPGKPQPTSSSSDRQETFQSPPSLVTAGDTFQEHLEEAKREIDTYIEENGLSEHIQTTIHADYLEIVNSNPLNFPQGKAELLESSLQYLDALIPVLRRSDFQIIVEGHTDDVPISTIAFRSNWELSAARAASFVTYLEEQGVDPKRLVVHGYGPNRPIAPNVSAEDRARNRRIRIMLKSADANTQLSEYTPVISSPSAAAESDEIP